jgi:hypothetical protein
MDLQAWRIQQDKKVESLCERVTAMEEELKKTLGKQQEFQIGLVNTMEMNSKKLLAGVQGQREADRRALNTWLKQKVGSLHWRTLFPPSKIGPFFAPTSFCFHSLVSSFCFSTGVRTVFCGLPNEARIAFPSQFCEEN